MKREFDQEEAEETEQHMADTTSSADEKQDGPGM